MTLRKIVTDQQARSLASRRIDGLRGHLKQLMSSSHMLARLDVQCNFLVLLGDFRRLNDRAYQ